MVSKGWNHPYRLYKIFFNHPTEKKNSRGINEKKLNFIKYNFLIMILKKKNIKHSINPTN